MSPENIAVAVWLGVALLLWIANSVYKGYRGEPIAKDAEMLCMVWPIGLLALLVFGPIYLLTIGAEWVGKKAAGR